MKTDRRTNEMHQYLTFDLGREIFALDIAEVREVLELTDITTIPRMPEHMCGVINLRGNAVPVMDMRRKMGMNQVEETVDTCIIISEVEKGDSTILMGSLVDSVRAVCEMPHNEVLPAPKMGGSVRSEFIAGIGQQEEGFVIVLDIGTVLAAEALELSRSMADGEACRIAA